MIHRYDTPPSGWVPTSTITCCVCNMVFAMSDIWRERRMDDHRTFFCIDGHAQHFVKDFQQTPGVYPGKVER